MKSSIFTLLFLVFIGFSLHAETSIPIYYTASLRGNLDGCDCGFHPIAGLSVRAEFLSGRESSSILIDAGDISDTTGDVLLSDAIIDVMTEMDYDIILPGETDFSHGASWGLAAFNRSPYGAQNYLMPVFSPSRTNSIVQSNLNGEMVYIIPLVEKEISLQIDKTVIPAPYPVLSEEFILNLLEKEPYISGLVVVAFYGSKEKAHSLAEAYPWIDLIILGKEQLLLEKEMVNNTLITSPGDLGNYIGFLNLQVSQGKITSYTQNFIELDYKKDPHSPWVDERIEDYYSTLFVQ